MNVRLIGNFVQHLEVELQPGETFYSQKGALICSDAGIDRQSVLNTGPQGTAGGLLGTLGNLISAKVAGESIVLCCFRNIGSRPARLLLGSRMGLLPLKLEGEELLCCRGAYVASSAQVAVSARVSIAGVMGGMGVFLQRISGRATVFLDVVGQPIVRELHHGETVDIDENHIVALQGIPEGRMQSVWALGNLIGGEGLSLLRVTGPGKIYLSPGNVGRIG